MYNGGYSQATKYKLPGQRTQRRSKGRSCGYYLRIIFFFSSLIQSLIIVSLVLFLVYGKQADSASMARVQHLEESFNQLSLENVELRLQRTNLTYRLNMTQIKLNQSNVEKIRLSNISLILLKAADNKNKQCDMELQKCRSNSGGTPFIQSRGVVPGTDRRCQDQYDQLKTVHQMVQSNFTTIVTLMRIEMEQIAKERDSNNLDAIEERREKSMLQHELTTYRVKCTEDFIGSLKGISNVTKAFLDKIDTLFNNHMFQITCEKQRDYLLQIRGNCTGLSREVEDKFQRYLDNVGKQVKQTLDRISNLEAENKQLWKDYNWCKQNRSDLIWEHKQFVQKHQLKCDKEKEKLLIEKRRHVEEKELQDMNIKVKDGEIRHLQNQLKHLNASCNTRSSTGGAGTSFGSSFATANTGSSWNSRGGSNSYSSTGNGLGRSGLGIGSSSGLGSSGSSLNKPASGGLGSSSLGSNGLNLGSTGLGPTKPVSTGLGSTNLGLNRSTFSSGSTVHSSSRPASNGVSLTNLGSTSSSGIGSGRKTGSSSTGLGSTGLGNTGLGNTGLGNTGLGNTGLGNTGLGNTGYGNTGHSYTGLGASGGLGSTGRTATGGTGLSSWPRTGSSSSSFGTGGGLGGYGGYGGSGTVNLLHHLQELQQVVNGQSQSQSTEERKQDQSRTSIYG